MRSILYRPRRDKICLQGLDKARFKPVSSATENSQKIRISPEAILDMILSKKNTKNKGADQSARMRRLVCAFVVRKHRKAVFTASRPNYVMNVMNYVVCLYELRHENFSSVC